jgi:very-short-patch-repair endonuclease
MSDFDYESFMIRSRLKIEFYDLEKITDKWGYIRQAYMEFMPIIIDKAKKNKCIGFNPYFIDWGQHFSPIEHMAWNSIRCLGRIVLYPQFPVFNYFIDFANPALRIGLELDGKDYHDEKKDLARDQMLADFGWKIFRVSGSECYTDFVNLDDLNEDESLDEAQRDAEIRKWLLNTCDGVINSLKMVYFEQHLDEKYLDIAYESLDKHRLAKNFDI